MNPRLVTLFCLLAALGCYATGLALPATALLVLGGILELVFWVRILRPERPRQAPDSAAD